MMKDITHALPEDAATIIELQKLACQSEAELYNDFSIPPLTQTIEELKNEFTYKVILKIEIEGKIVGSVRGWEKENTCFVGRLIVHPHFQGQGIGTALMEQIELSFSHVQRFELFAGHKSERNIHFYERLGYKIFKNQEINKNLIFMFMEKQN